MGDGADQGDPAIPEALRAHFQLVVMYVQSCPFALLCDVLAEHGWLWGADPVGS